MRLKFFLDMTHAVYFQINSRNVQESSEDFFTISARVTQEGRERKKERGGQKVVSFPVILGEQKCRKMPHSNSKSQIL